MASAEIHSTHFEVSMEKGPTVVDITPRLTRIVSESGIVDGTMNVTSIGSTGSITTIEHEPGVVEDLCRAITRLAPPGDDYAHEQAWHDGNGHSHVQAALVGPSIVVPVRDGRLALGTWQNVVVINHDNRARQRGVAITVVGTVDA